MTTRRVLAFGCADAGPASKSGVAASKVRRFM